VPQIAKRITTVAAPDMGVMTMTATVPKNVPRALTALQESVVHAAWACQNAAPLWTAASTKQAFLMGIVPKRVSLTEAAHLDLCV